MGTPASRNAFRTPMCATLRAAPPLKARPTRQGGRLDSPRGDCGGASPGWLRSMGAHSTPLRPTSHHPPSCSRTLDRRHGFRSGAPVRLTPAEFRPYSSTFDPGAPGREGHRRGWTFHGWRAGARLCPGSCSASFWLASSGLPPSPTPRPEGPSFLRRSCGSHFPTAPRMDRRLRSATATLCASIPSGVSRSSP